MIRKLCLTAAMTAAALIIRVSAAFSAQSSDPTKIGENAKNIVEPNAKSFWWILLIGGLLYMASTRKGSRAAAMGVTLLISGIAIWNPAGVTSMMQGVADKIV